MKGNCEVKVCCHVLRDGIVGSFAFVYWHLHSDRLAVMLLSFAETYH